MTGPQLLFGRWQSVNTKLSSWLIPKGQLMIKEKNNWMSDLINAVYNQSTFQFSSVAQSCPTLRPHEPQHTRLPCPSLTARVHPNPCPSSWGCNPTISPSVVPFSSCPQSFRASGSFPMSQLFASSSQSIGVSASASVFLVNIQDWSPLGFCCCC